MPLKHHTESAYLFLLGLVMCLSGVFLALLPDYPTGLKYWGAGFAVAVLYPLVLRTTFRANRADYEFRLLHWFPAGMFILWIAMQLADPYLHVFHILNLGFFYLWSLPLVILGLFFIGVFAAHVLRRKKQRIWTMVIVGLLFTGTAMALETLSMNADLSRAVFPREGKTVTVTELAETAKERFGFFVIRQKRALGLLPPLTMPGDRLAQQSSVSSLAVKPIQRSSSSASRQAMEKIDHLTKSGPEGFALLALTMLALYAGTLHRRASARVLVD